MDHPARDPLPEPPAEPTPRPSVVERPIEHGGRRPDVSKGLEPTRFGDWEKDGRCIDF